MKNRKNRGNITFIILPLLALWVVLLTSCKDNSFILGSEYLESNVRTVIIDTCTVKMSTITIDSVVTSGKDMVLIGSNIDTIVGYTKCTSYLVYTVPETQSFPEATIVFDSIDLVMVLNGEWRGDTTHYHKFDIYSLTEVIEPRDDDDFYSTQSVTHENIPASNISIKPRPLRGDTISVRLPDYIGSDLLKKIMDEDDAILGSQERFMNYLKGFAITSGEDNNCVLGFHISDSSMAMRIHYHYSTWERTEEVITIPPYKVQCFYGVTSDRTSTSFEDLKNNELPSSVTGNMALIQALNGSYVKIDLPYLNSLLELGNLCTVVTAKLVICPVRGTYSGMFPLPTELSMYITDENYVTTGAIINYSGNALQTGSLVINEFPSSEAFYTYDITSFLQDQLGAIGIYKRQLVLSVPSEKQSVTTNTLVATDVSYTDDNRSKLEITYLIYDNK